MKIGNNKGYLIILVFIITIICFWYILPEYGMMSIATPFYITGLFCYIFGRKWNNKALNPYLHKETGKEVNLKRSHSLFLIKMQYWAIPFIFCATILLSKSINQVDGDLYLIIQNAALVFFFVSLIFVTIKVFENSKYKRYFIIIWSGKGYLIILAFLFTFISLTLLFPTSKHIVAAPFYITALFCFIFGKIRNDKVAETVIDQETGKEVSFKTSDSLFLIKVKYWAFIFIVFAVIITFGSPTRTSKNNVNHKSYFNENF
ncbi:hypothetical protein IRZ71_23445 [Flavobacterium sp. ANB]|uniref:hypothetical protein n=1 Tax=unclassified Flavobacterium TaxID=196869 RepID=UPI0012B9EB40|nr:MULTISPECIES: hypothetical protein [unclassified Flavobacterium]MBF4519313.1 hypothetical protein [Flavobacterium sp. ANB]MTD72256.1 hypothetical protein [Flavobacterium sp. LC2016-13]